MTWWHLPRWERRQRCPCPWRQRREVKDVSQQRLKMFLYHPPSLVPKDCDPDTESGLQHPLWAGGTVSPSHKPVNESGCTSRHLLRTLSEQTSTASTSFFAWKGLEQPGHVRRGSQRTLRQCAHTAGASLPSVLSSFIPALKGVPDVTGKAENKNQIQSLLNEH